MSVVDKVLPKIETVKVYAYSKDTRLVPSDLALAIYSLMMLVNGQTHICVVSFPAFYHMCLSVIFYSFLSSQQYDTEVRRDSSTYF